MKKYKKYLEIVELQKKLKNIDYMFARGKLTEKEKEEMRTLVLDKIMTYIK